MIAAFAAAVVLAFFALAGADNVGISRIEYQVRGTPTGSAAPDDNVTFDSTRVAHGLAEVRAVAFDTTNSSAAQTRTVMIDNTAPTVAVAGADGGKPVPGTTLRWTIDAADSIGIASG